MVFVCVYSKWFTRTFNRHQYHFQLEHNRENDLLDSAKSIRDHHKQCKGDDLSEFSYLDAINIFEHLKNNKGALHINGFCLRLFKMVHTDF
jgi:hypothetical protein